MGVSEGESGQTDFKFDLQRSFICNITERASGMGLNLSGNVVERKEESGAWGTQIKYLGRGRVFLIPI